MDAYTAWHRMQLFKEHAAALVTLSMIDLKVNNPYVQEYNELLTYCLTMIKTLKITDTDVLDKHESVTKNLVLNKRSTSSVRSKNMHEEMQSLLNDIEVILDDLK
jgi:hypothetical protein